MIELPLVIELLLAFSLTLALIFAYLTVMEKDLIRAVVFSAGQSIAFAYAYYLLFAPDIVLAYIAVGVGIYSMILIFAISKTERYEKV